MRQSGYYLNLFVSMHYLPGWEARIRDAAQTIRAGEKRYVTVGARLAVPWKIIGIIHMLEASCDFRAGLHNGQPWNQRTTMAPAGKGPFASWELAAIDALKTRGTAHTIEEAGAFFERYNGTGYERRGVNSPYLWSGSNHGVDVGKYVADGHYDPKAVSKQIGAMLLLRELGTL